MGLFGDLKVLFQPNRFCDSVCPHPCTGVELLLLNIVRSKI